jgi:hypothetical protein
MHDTPCRTHALFQMPLCLTGSFAFISLGAYLQCSFLLALCVMTRSHRCTCSHWTSMRDNHVGLHTARVSLSYAANPVPYCSRLPCIHEYPRFSSPHCTTLLSQLSPGPNQEGSTSTFQFIMDFSQSHDREDIRGSGQSENS